MKNRNKKVLKNHKWKDLMIWSEKRMPSWPKRNDNSFDLIFIDKYLFKGIHLIDISIIANILLRIISLISIFDEQKGLL